MKRPMRLARSIMMILALTAGVAHAAEPALPEALPVAAAATAAPVEQSGVEEKDVAAEKAATVSAETNGFRLKTEPVRGESGGMAAATLQMVLGLALVLAVIFALAWLAKRLNLNVAGSSAELRVLSAMTVGPKEKILMLEVEGKRLLLGVTAQQITLLQTLEGAAPETASAPVAGGGFAEKMQALLKSGALHEK